MKEENLVLLRKVGLFSELDTGILLQIASVVIEKDFSKGKTIFFEGEEATAIYFVKKGKIKIAKMSEQGKEIIVHILGPGDIFAEVTLFQKNTVYPVTAEVIENAKVGMIRNEDLEKIILEKPQVAVELIRALTEKIMVMQERIRHLGSNDAVDRTIQVLLTLAHGHGTKTNHGIQICVNINRQDLASFVGTTRETISRILSRLANAKIIDISGKNIVITDLEGLKNWEVGYGKERY